MATNRQARALAWLVHGPMGHGRTPPVCLAAFAAACTPSTENGEHAPTRTLHALEIHKAVWHGLFQALAGAVTLGSWGAPPGELPATHVITAAHGAAADGIAGALGIAAMYGIAATHVAGSPELVSPQPETLVVSGVDMGSRVDLQYILDQSWVGPGQIWV